MFTAAYFIMPRSTNNPMSSADEQINKTWCVPTMEYYPAMKRNRVLIHTTALINLENYMLNEGNQPHKTTHSPFI